MRIEAANNCGADDKATEQKGLLLERQEQVGQISFKRH